MQVEVNGAQLWFDVVGPSLVADGPQLRTDQRSLPSMADPPATSTPTCARTWTGWVTKPWSCTWISPVTVVPTTVMRPPAARNDAPMTSWRSAISSGSCSRSCSATRWAGRRPARSALPSRPGGRATTSGHGRAPRRLPHRGWGSGPGSTTAWPTSQPASSVAERPPPTCWPNSTASSFGR
jgi:hypothetical protein